MQKMNAVDSPYSATCNSQPLTFIDNDFIGAENTQATDYNYELTFPNEHNFQTQQQSQLDGGGIGPSSQLLDNIEASQVRTTSVSFCKSTLSE